MGQVIYVSSLNLPISHFTTFKINSYEKIKSVGPSLDEDGKFYDDLSYNSRKIFLLGEKQGVINIKVQYTDNSIDTLQSYCSKDTYLVEQL